MLASRRGIDGGRHLPFRLGGQPPPRPAAERLRLVPVHVHDRMPWIERHEPIESSLEPAAGPLLAPEERMLDRLPPAPVPAAPAPPFAPPIAAVVDEGLELRVGDGRRGDPERLDSDGMCPLLVVEDERLVGIGAEHEGAAGDGDVVRAELGIDRRRATGRIEARGPRIAQGLEDRRQVLGVHVLVQRGQRVEVDLVATRRAGLEPRHAPPQHLRDVRERGGARRKAVIPASRVGHVERVVDRVRAGQDGVGAIEPAQQPVLLEPADVAHLPDRRLKEVPARAEHLRVREIVEQCELDTARVEQRVEQCLGRGERFERDHRVPAPAVYRRVLAPQLPISRGELRL